MNPFQKYLTQKLQEQLDKHPVVVFYDPRREFEPFLAELPAADPLSAAPGEPALPRVTIGERGVVLARFEGSFFRLRAQVEPIIASDAILSDEPTALLLYLPGILRDPKGSLLMELEEAGTRYEPQLKQLARYALRQSFTDGQIDPLLRAETLGYADVVAFFRQADDGRTASVLRSLFPGTNDDTLLLRWLASDAHDAHDAAIAAKDAAAELLALIAARLGLELPATTPLADVRAKTLRYLLVGEYRSDLGCEPPAALRMIPSAPTAELQDRQRELAERLRHEHGDAYVALADRVERELDLADQPIDPAYLGAIDTFRFEERLLLGHAGERSAAGAYAEALAIVIARHRSFWVDRDVARQVQWEACRLVAELGLAVERVRPTLAKTGADPAVWVSAYAAAGGWHTLDQLQRTLESWVAKMDDDPEGERALNLVRRVYEDLLQAMAEGFSKALRAAAWHVPGVLAQTRIYPEVVEPMLRSAGRVAYFLVDALRFEMGAELARQLEGGEQLRLRPAVAALPTITPVGMAALLPGAASGFSVIEHKAGEHKGQLAATIDGTPLPSWAERRKLLEAKAPGMVELTLGNLLAMSTSQLAKTLGSAALVVVRSQEIDFAGESDRDLLARQVMDTVIGNLARAVRKLARAGVEGFVISADHGHQFAGRKSEDMRTDPPGGQTVDIHRRCWVGHGGTTPPGTVRVSGAELGYATDLDLVFPTGLGVFKTGGGLAYHHGGASLQELVVPVLSLRLPSVAAGGARGGAAGAVGVRLLALPERIDNRTFGVRLRAEGDLFTPAVVALRVVLLAGEEQVGQVGMAIDAELDRATGVLSVRPGTDVGVGFRLTRDDSAAVRIVVLDPATDALLAESAEIPVRLLL